MICGANQMIGFYMKCNAGLKWVKVDVAASSSMKTLRMSPYTEVV